MLKALKEAGFPKDVLQIIPGGDETGKALVKSEVNKIFLVGSVEAGKDIMKNAGIKAVQFELGGNSSGIVMQDANLDLAVKGLVWGATYHSGQDCVGIKRVFVHKSLTQKFIEKCVLLLEQLVPAKDYGPYITKEARDEVKSRIKLAIKDGGELIFGGEIPTEKNLKYGNWLTPALLKLKDQKSKIVKEETFGNVMPIMEFSTEQELVKMVNDTNYGLSNSIFSKDVKNANRVAMMLNSGMVFINDPLIAIPGWDHWTGWKDSGFGTVESKLMQCLKKKVVSINKSKCPRSFWYSHSLSK